MYNLKMNPYLKPTTGKVYNVKFQLPALLASANCTEALQSGKP